MPSTSIPTVYYPGGDGNSQARRAARHGQLRVYHFDVFLRISSRLHVRTITRSRLTFMCRPNGPCLYTRVCGCTRVGSKVVRWGTFKNPTNQDRSGEGWVVGANVEPLRPNHAQHEDRCQDQPFLRGQGDHHQVCEANRCAFVYRYDGQVLLYQALLYEIYFSSPNYQGYLCVLVHSSKQASHLSCQLKSNSKVCDYHGSNRRRLRPLSHHLFKETQSRPSSDVRHLSLK